MNIFKVFTTVFEFLVVSYFGAQFIINHPPINSEVFFIYLVFGLFNICLVIYSIVRLAIKHNKD